MKTGTCKYGSTCKYDHPRQGAGLAQPVMLNYYGYPLRPVGNTLLNVFCFFFFFSFSFLCHNVLLCQCADHFGGSTKCRVRRSAPTIWRPANASLVRLVNLITRNLVPPRCHRLHQHFIQRCSLLRFPQLINTQHWQVGKSAGLRWYLLDHTCQALMVLCWSPLELYQCKPGAPIRSVKNIWFSFPDLEEEFSNRNANYMQIFDRPDNFKCFLSLCFHIIPSEVKVLFHKSPCWSSFGGI